MTPCSVAQVRASGNEVANAFAVVTRSNSQLSGSKIAIELL